MNTHQSPSTGFKQSGFVLIEAMVVTSLLVFGMVAGNKTQVNLIKAKADSNQHYKAVQLFNQKMEELRDYSTIAGYNNLASGSDVTTTFDTTFNRSWTITNYSKYKKVEHSVTWTNSDNETTSLVSASFISQNDPMLSGQIFNSTSTTTNLPSIGSGVNQNSSTPPTPPSTTTGSSYDVTVPGSSNVLTYDANNNIIQINHMAAVTLSGTVSLATGSRAPSNSVTLANITLTPVTSNNLAANCFYNNTTGAFSCIFASGWTGSILVGGISNVKICVVNQQPYTNLRTALNNQTYEVVKSGRSCPASNPYLLQSL